MPKRGIAGAKRKIIFVTKKDFNLTPRNVRWRVVVFEAQPSLHNPSKKCDRPTIYILPSVPKRNQQKSGSGGGGEEFKSVDNTFVWLNLSVIFVPKEN